MAATLTDELTRVSVADIEKWDEGPDGTVYVYGRCTTPEVDTDDQVVDSGWSGPALKEYLATAPTVRVQHNPQRDPAGSAVRVDVNRDGDGAHWLKAAVDEPIAARLVKRGHLRAFSVGIARPVIERDVTGKARGGIIKGGKIVEVSLVDSPANRSCFLEIAKSADDGTCEITGKLVADDDVIQKALAADLTKDGSADTWTETSADMSGFQMPADLDITFTPNDMARLMQAKVVEKHYAGLAAKASAGPDAVKRDVSTAERRSLASEHNALPDGSYPINSAGDLHNAAVLARSGHGDVAAARRLIARRAGELGVANPLDESDGANKSISEGEGTGLTALPLAPADLSQAPLTPVLTPLVAKEAEPEVTKEPEGTPAEPKPKPVKKAKGKKKKLPPWLNKPDDDGKGSGGDSGACKSVTDHLWTGTEGTSEIVCSKCRTTPAEAAGLSGTHDMTCAPVPELLESPPMASTKGSPTPQSASGAAEAPSMTPVPQHREPDGAIVEPFEKDAGLPATGQGETPTRLEAGMMKASPEVAAILRFKAAGIDAELGRVHDLTCPAYHPDDVAKCHPFADFRSVLDEGYFQRKAVEAACGPSMDRAKSLHLAWQAAAVLKKADPAELNDYRLAAHKAFRDANPGPSSAPTPGMISPGKYNRPLITDGHSATSTGHDGPNTSPQVATSAPDAHSFDRPPLSAGHQTPSPSFMKASFEYPHETGRPVQLDYAVTEKERARHALMQMHEHLSRQFPEVCPMSLDAPPVQPERHPVPAAVGKSAGDEAEVLKSEAPALGAHLTNVTVTATKSAAPSLAAILKAPAEGDLVDDAVYKGFKKMRKKLGKKVLAGKMTVDEARTHLGRQFAQKSADEEAVQKSAAPELSQSERVTYQGADIPGLIKSAVAEAFHVETVPLETAVVSNFGIDPETVKTAVAEATSELKDLLVKQQETFTTKLAEQQRVIDAIADQPDPSTAAFSGLAFNPVRKNARPAGVLSQAEAAERSQQMMIRHLTDTYNSASDAYEREAARATLTRLRGGDA